MKLKKPKFWDYHKPNISSNLLLPLSKIFHYLSKIEIKKAEKFNNIKCICVGNIYLGGTGKTTLSIELKKILEKENIKICFIKKDYPDQIDEVRLLKQHGKIFINKDRKKALREAVSEYYQVAIFDDGLQDKTISYDLIFVCFNQKNMIGNGRLIPAGPLRDNLDSLKLNNNIFIIGNNKNNIDLKNILLQSSKNLNFFEASYEPINLEKFDRSINYVVFSGIGNHGTFIEMLKRENFKLIRDFEYPDHYKYSFSDLNKISSFSKKYNAQILTTKKDFLRIDDDDKKNIKYIDIYLEIKQIKELLKKLKLVYENN